MNNFLEIINLSKTYESVEKINILNNINFRLPDNVLVALTNNVTKGNYFGSILKIEEEGGRHESLTFKSETYLAGGEETGFAAPDNMVFDRAGNLWFTSDISGSSVNKPPYEMFKNNGLFVVPREGIDKGKVIGEGKHEELVKSSDVYKNFYEKQIQKS